MKPLVIIRVFLLFVLLLSYGKIIIGQTIQKEGLVNYVSMLDSDGFKQNIWFKDSTVIYEVYQYYRESINDSIVSEGRRIYKYSILDLTNMRAQDYLSFSDTATPVTNYFLTDIELISWKFYGKTHPYDKYMDSLIPMPDSILEGKKYKRFYFDLSDTGWHQRLTYYLSCSAVNNIFHLARRIDDKYPGCKVTHVQYTDMLTGFTAFNKLQNIRGSLTLNERMIFEKWEKNMTSTTLPITTYTEAQKYFQSIFNGKNFRIYHH